MNIKKLVVAAIVLFVFMFIYESLVHGVLLASIYNETPNIWRDYTQMQTYITYNITIMAIIAVWLTFVFTQLFKAGGWKNGLRFGLYFGVLSGIQAAGAYFYLPISATLAGLWFIVYVIESLLGGLLLGSVYRQ